jgi:hypothetical protein
MRHQHRLLLHTLLTSMAFATTGMSHAQDYETPAHAKAGDFAPAALMKSDLHRVDDSVSIEGGMPRFTIRSPYGSWQARGTEMLEIRVSELPALQQFASLSKTDAFGKAAKTALTDQANTVGQLIEHPVDTVSNVAAGIGILAGRVGALASAAATRVGDTVNGNTKTQKPILKAVEASAGTAEPRKIIGGPLGYNQKRREWAGLLKVDPYTNNAALSDQLGDFAAASFAGSFPVNVAIGVVAAPLSYTTELKQAAQLEATQYPPIDVETRNAERLKKMGIEGLPVRTLFRNSYFTPTLQTALVLALESLGNIAGRADVVAFASRAASDDEARYVINSVSLLARHGRTIGALTKVRSADNVLAGISADGKLLIPVPLDYIPWIKAVDDFAQRTDLSGSERWLLVNGKLTPIAMQELGKRGWKVVENLAAATASHLGAASPIRQAGVE